MSSNVVVKKNDPRDFTISCTIGMFQFAKALYDFGACINLMLYDIFKKLGLGEPKPTTMRLLMANRSIKHPMGILYDILVKMDKFIFPADFVIVNCEIDDEVPIILGRLFMATDKALDDVESSELTFRINDEEVTFNVCKLMKQPSNLHVILVIDVIDEVLASVSEVSCVGESLTPVLLNYYGEKSQDYDELVAALSCLGSYSNRDLKLDIDLKNRESPPTKRSMEEPQKLELKVLLSNLHYVFLGANNTLPHDYCGRFDSMASASAF
ncbi:uncharacterized protein [Solanum tuberosum]|uniref:uncharacterized protein n=1 Tax=Solanum tuberosum TaxID=4113 RepID=UPI00073A0439|nr:PREDICTED: uncharacterized protein LOC107060669 [Solanum tuberosum]